MSAALESFAESRAERRGLARAPPLSVSCWRCWRCFRSTRRSPATRFLLTLFTRVLILAIGAVSLNLIMGYGGMVSFGHAAYLGIGGYAVGILAKEGIGTGFVQWPVAVAASAALCAGRRCA